MTYCSLEEAWGSDFKDSSFYAKVNAQPQAQVQEMSPQTQNGTEELNQYFPSYSGGAPTVTHTQTAKSNIVPYQVSFPDRSKRNYLFPVESNIKDDESDKDSALEVLEDSERDIRYIDRQRRIVSDYDDYMTTEDYFLYKKYLKLAEKYKEKLRRKYRNFIEEDSQNKTILEGFADKIPSVGGSPMGYSIKDIIILIIVGIFLIFALDIFVKMGSNFKK